ncbi:MAG: hypothetical protein ABR924_17460 [Terracidiphilus sp.]|jgi:hypothetical protein
MSKPLDAYLERSRRVALLMAWLESEIDAHEARAMQSKTPRELLRMTAELGHIEEELKGPVCSLSRMMDTEISEALNEGGKDNE